jgi:FeS assembly SUF system protein
MEDKSTQAMPEPDLIQLGAKPFLQQIMEDSANTPELPHSDLELGPQQQILKEKIIEALETIYDPEIPVNIYELGLIYNIAISAENDVTIRMTLTSPACPVAGSLPGEVEMRVQAVEGVRDATIKLVWDPPYNMDMMSEEARLTLGLL